MIKWLKRIFYSGVALLLLVLLLNYKVKNDVKESMYDNITETPSKKVGLLLGTAKYVKGGWINLYYTHRITAAVELYKAGKIEYILISGDNGRESYDEPTLMKEDLMAAGIPESAIYLDYAGFRTLDSVVRCKRIFGELDILVISQQFHNERAVYIARAKGIQAIGYNAQDVNAKYGFKTRIREYLARTKMFLDLWFGKEPKFLGEEIQIG
ncbi:MAG: SanA protein [Pseudoalteromonas distincta]|jgi:SanA protein